MSDYIKRADAIESVKNTILKRFNLADWYEEILNCGVEIEDTIKALPSADAKGDLIRRADIQYHTQLEPMGNGQYSDVEVAYKDDIDALPSADAVQEAIPTVVRVTMSDGSQYYLEHERDAIHADAVQGEWIWRTDIPIGDGRTSAGYICSNCGKDYWHGNVFNYCPSCGAYMTHKEGE